MVTAQFKFLLGGRGLCRKFKGKNKETERKRQEGNPQSMDLGNNYLYNLCTVWTYN